MITIGCDPEVFLKDKATGKFVSGHNLIPGTKYEPHPVPRGAVLVDGTALEFNIQPAKTLGEFVNNTSTVLANLEHMVRSQAPLLELAIVATAKYTDSDWKTIPKLAKELGCEPDFDAWTGAMNPRPDHRQPMRTAAGHIHLGWTEEAEMYDTAHYFDCLQTVKQLDAVLYVPSLLWDNDNERRTMYGKIGAFRPKPYGVEYRSLSNQWLTDTQLVSWVYLASKRAVELLDDDRLIFEHGDYAPTLQVVRSGHEVSREEAMAYTGRLVGAFGLPHLPEKYTKRAK